jgi:hypothetical protein
MSNQYLFLLFIINAAITPGIQPQQVSINTNNTEPHPLSNMAKGGKIIHNITRKRDMIVYSL